MTIAPRLKKTISYSIKTGGTVGGVAGVFSDFLLPLANIGLLLSAGFAALFLALLVIRALFNTQVINMLNALRGDENNPNDDSGNVWFAPLASAILMMSALTLGAYSLSTSPGNEDKGYIASHLPLIEELQIQTGVLARIEDNTREMISQQKESNAHLNDVSGNTKQLVEIQLQGNATLQTLSEESIRQTFTPYGYSQAVSLGNLDRVKHYLDSPNWLDSIHVQASQFSSTKSVADSLIRSNNNEAAVKILKLLIDRELINPAERLNVPINTEIQALIDKHINSPIQKTYETEKSEHDTKMAKHNLELEALQAQADEIRTKQVRESNECTIAIEKDTAERAEFDKLIQDKLDRINIEKRVAHDKAVREFTSKQAEYKKREKAHREYIRTAHYDGCESESACLELFRAESKWLEANRGKWEFAPGEFIEDNIYNNNEIKALRHSQTFELPDCAATAFSGTTYFDISRKLSQDMQAKRREISILQSTKPRPPMKVFGIRVEQSLLWIAEETGHDQFVAFLRTQPQPGDTYSLVFYSSAGEILYKE